MWADEEGAGYEEEEEERSSLDHLEENLFDGMDSDSEESE